MGAPFPFNCTPKAPPCCGSAGGLSPCVQCNASTPVGCEGFSFNSSAAAAGAQPPQQPSAWADEAATKAPWIHGYFNYDFGDEYQNISSAKASGATITLAIGGNAKPSKPGARFYVLNLLAELDAEG